MEIDSDVWFFHKICTSSHYRSATLTEVQNSWTLEDIADALIVIDELDSASQQLAEKE